MRDTTEQTSHVCCSPAGRLVVRRPPLAGRWLAAARCRCVAVKREIGIQKGAAGSRIALRRVAETRKLRSRAHGLLSSKFPICMGFGWAERMVVHGPPGPPCTSATGQRSSSVLKKQITLESKFCF